MPILRTAEKTAEINSVRRSGPRDRHYVIDSGEVATTFADPQKMLDTIEMGPGKLFSWDRGVKIRSIAPESVFAAMGLRKGDLLPGINDQEINDTGEAVSMLQTMFDAGEAELRVRRRARTYRIHLQDLLVM